MPLPISLAKSLPDIPSLVEVRSYLLSNECEILGYKDRPDCSFILRIVEEELIYIVGRPDLQEIKNTISDFKERGTIIAPQVTFNWLAPLLTAWKTERIFVYALNETHHLPQTEQINIHFLDSKDLTNSDIDFELLEELKSALNYTDVAAVYVDDKPVSFCYASSQTETLWDVGIDTLPEYQRKGYARLCFSFMARHMKKRGKTTTVWQALESNPASWLMASKLNFTKVGELAYFAKN
jgi:RimJ/RimL family protein N-acetyltransferase